MAEKEMHKAVCADCGKECEVPFKPDPSRPVYCLKKEIQDGDSRLS
jgi:CxxC-x17-CxxC domain-containing protein